MHYLYTGIISRYASFFFLYLMHTHASLASSSAALLACSIVLALNSASYTRNDYPCGRSKGTNHTSRAQPDPRGSCPVTAVLPRSDRPELPSREQGRTGVAAQRFHRLDQLRLHGAVQKKIYFGQPDRCADTIEGISASRGFCSRGKEQDCSSTSHHNEQVHARQLCSQISVRKVPAAGQHILPLRFAARIQSFRAHHGTVQCVPYPGLVEHHDGARLHAWHRGNLGHL